LTLKKLFRVLACDPDESEMGEIIEGAAGFVRWFRDRAGSEKFGPVFVHGRKQLLGLTIDCAYHTRSRRG
jgi:hypothetical protein